MTTRKRSTKEKIERLLKSADNARNATNQRQRDAAITFMVTRALELEALKHELEVKLDSGWDTLEEWKREGKPEDYEKHHARYLAWLAEYEQICTALDDASRRWTRPVPGREGATA